LQPEPFELAAEFGRVVDLAVVAQHKSAAARHHGLGPGGREIDDRETGVGKRHAMLGVDPNATVVGAAMSKRGCHRAAHGL